MKNFIIFVASPMPLDDEFLEIDRRGDRKEMCAYRNAIVEERHRRKGSPTTNRRLYDEQLVATRHESTEAAESLPFRLTRWLYLAIALLWIGVAGQSLGLLITTAKSGDIITACLLGFLMLSFLALALGSFARFTDEKYVRFSQLMAAFLFLKDSFGRKQKSEKPTSEVLKPGGDSSEGAVKPAVSPSEDADLTNHDFVRTIRGDSDTTLMIKQNRLDSLLF